MSRLIKVAGWDGSTRVNVIFVHGLGGHAYDTWRQRLNNETFWPVWLSHGIPGVTVWTLAYEAPPTNWVGAAMPIQDRAKNILECLLGQRELKDVPLVFVCHSLGGLVIKQVLRAADGRRGFPDAEAQSFLELIKGVVFIATPHTGSLHATLLDKLRLFTWPSASALDVVKNNANLRDLNIWYRNWSGKIRHKVYYEKKATAVGVVVDDDSSDPGLLHVDPVGIDADHSQISKPADLNDLVYSRTRDFLVNEIGLAPQSTASCGKFHTLDLPEIPRPRFGRFTPIALRLILLSITCLIGFKGIESVFFPPDPLDRATVEEISEALYRRASNLSSTQVDQFIKSLREARNDPSYARAVKEARMGNSRVAEGIWFQIYENRKKESQQARKEQAEAARNLAASVVINNAGQGLVWYREATSLDPDDLAGWLGLGYAALSAGTLQESEAGFQRFILLAQAKQDEDLIALGLSRLGYTQEEQGNLADAFKSFSSALSVAKRRAEAAPFSPDLQLRLSVIYIQIGDLQVAQGDLTAALKSFLES